MKILKRIANVFLGLIFVLAVGILLISTISSRSNHGVPNFFGYQVMVVKTDSMEPTLMVGTGIIVQKDDIASLVPQEKDDDGNIITEGDIVTYVNRYNIVVTHRLIGLTSTTNETTGEVVYTLETIGENEHSNQCGKDICTYTPEFISQNNYMGKVVTISGPLGGFFTFMNNPITMIALIGIPIAFLIVSLIYDSFFAKGDDSDDEEEETIEETKSEEA